MGNDAFIETRNAIRKEAEGIITGNEDGVVSTGYADLDSIIMGLKNGSLYVIGGRPAMGKTAFALNLLENICVEDKKACLYYSFEQTRERLIERLLRQISRVELYGQELKADKKKLIEEVSLTVSKAELIIEDNQELTIDLLVKNVKENSDRGDIGVIIVDYLQLIPVSESCSFCDSTSYIMNKLKNLAKELDKPVIVLSQLNRKPEFRADHRPMISDLRGSGSIENYADVVLFLYRDEYYYSETPIKSILEVIVAKNNYGPIGTAELAYRVEYGKIFSIERR